MSLWRVTKQQHGRVCRPPFVQQVPVRQQLVGMRILSQSKAGLVSGAADEPPHAIRIEIVHGRTPAAVGIERAGTQQQVVVQVLDQCGVQPADELHDGFESLSDQFPFGSGDQCRHWIVPCCTRSSLQVNQAVFAALARTVELAPRRRNAFPIRCSVFQTEYADIDIAALHFV